MRSSQIAASRAGQGLLLTLLLATATSGATRNWIGGDVDWVDGGSNGNWTPADEPDPDDDAVFTTPNNVKLGSNNQINGLTLSGGINLYTQTWFLDVDGDIVLSDANTRLGVGGNNLAAPTNGLDAENITINSGATLAVGGTRIDYVSPAGVGVVDVNAGGTLFGNGELRNADAITTPAPVLINDGTITVGTFSTGIIIIGGAPAPRTLTISAVDVDALVDLDGFSGNGVVNIPRNQTLDVDVTISDPYSGDINLFHNSTLDVAGAWELDSGTIDVDNGFVPGTTIPFQPAIPADVAYIRGGTLVQSGGSINVIDSDGTLQFDAGFNMSGGNLVNNGTVVFNANSTIQAGANFTMPTSSSSITVNPGVEVNIDQPNFNVDGLGQNTNQITIGAGAILDVDLGVGGEELLSGRFNLNGGELDVTTNSGSWSIDGVGDVIVGAGTGTSTINGNSLTISGSTDVNVGAGATLLVNPALTFGSTSTTYTGAGMFRVGGLSTVATDTTIAVDTFDWDGVGVGSLQTINNGVSLTINSANLDTDGDVDDPVNLGGNGAGLFVNGPTEWEMEGLLTANTAGAGTAEIGGTSRMVITDQLDNDPVDLAVTGFTVISAPVTFGQNSDTDVGSGFSLTVTSSNARYDGAVISGLGTFLPGVSNFVQGDTDITSQVFDFDQGNWTIEAGATLSVNVNDYDTVATNALDATVTINSGTANVVTGDLEFVMDGVLNLNNTTGTQAVWSGEPLDIGDDLNSLDADLNVGGAGISRINSAVDFNGDADVNIAAGATLVLNTVAQFDTDAGNDGTADAQFTGSGALVTNSTVNFNEATTFDMNAGTVDLDGEASDLSGNLININAPVIMNVGGFKFGQAKIGTDTLDVDNLNAGNVGALTVNLPNANDEWVLDTPGVMNLLNGAAVTTLLSGNAAQLNGTVNADGDIRLNARVDIGGTVNILSVAADTPLRLNGGTLANPNTLVGGTINGPGVLSLDSSRALHGHGVINPIVDSNGSSELIAEGGLLRLNNAVIDIGTLGTNGPTAVLDLTTNTFITSVSQSGVRMLGGRIQNGGLQITTQPLVGHGLVLSPIDNDGEIIASGGQLEIDNPSNDYDGSGNAGKVTALAGSNLILRDNATFLFRGTVQANSGGDVFADGFELEFDPPSTLQLNGGRYRSTAATDIGGTVNVTAGTSSIVIAGTTVFENGSNTTLTGDLVVDTPNTVVAVGATFSGGGSLINANGAQLRLLDGATANVLVENNGTMVLGGSPGQATAGAFFQGASGTLEIELAGAAPSQVDTLMVSSTAQLDGALDLSLLGGFAPTLGQTFTILTALSRTGMFSSVSQPATMPAGLMFDVLYNATNVQLQVVASPSFTADFDMDGDVDAADLAQWQGDYGVNGDSDANGDSMSNGVDFLEWQRQLGSGTPVTPAVATVPEPRSVGLLGLAAATALVRRRRS